MLDSDGSQPVKKKKRKEKKKGKKEREKKGGKKEKRLQAVPDSGCQQASKDGTNLAKWIRQAR